MEGNCKGIAGTQMAARSSSDKDATFDAVKGCVLSCPTCVLEVPSSIRAAFTWVPAGFVLTSEIRFLVVIEFLLLKCIAVARNNIPNTVDPAMIPKSSIA
jgi:hypothetical protein